MKKALGYIRVSSKEQGKSGVGLELQEIQLRAFAEADGYSLLHVHSEVVSAIGGDSFSRRPVLQSVMAEAKQKQIPILIVTMDRLSRDYSELKMLRAAPGVVFKFIDDAIAPEYVHLHVKAAAVHRQTEILSKRTKEGISKAKANGVLFGNRKNLSEAQRLGAAANRTKARENVEFILPEIKKLKSSGFKTANSIASALNDLGKNTPSGKPWTEANLRRVLNQIKAFEKESEVDFYKNDPTWGMF